jgi:hypothetical protein
MNTWIFFSELPSVIDEDSTVTEPVTSEEVTLAPEDGMKEKPLYLTSY